MSAPRPLTLVVPLAAAPKAPPRPALLGTQRRHGNRWEVKWPAPATDPATGRVRQKPLYQSFATEAEATAFRVKLTHEQNLGVVHRHEDHKYTVADAIEAWLARCEA